MLVSNLLRFRSSKGFSFMPRLDRSRALWCAARRIGLGEDGRGDGKQHMNQLLKRSRMLRDI